MTQVCKRGLILGLLFAFVSVVACAQSGPPLLNGQPAKTGVDATFNNVGVKTLTPGQCVTVGSGPNYYLTSTGAACGGGAGGGVSGAGTGLNLSGGGTIVNLTVPVIAANGGTGNTTNTAHGFMLGEGTSALTSLVCASGTLAFGGGASADPTCRVIANADLPTSGVTAGSYTLASITVNAQGIVTAAANGTGSTTVRAFMHLGDSGVVTPGNGRIPDALNLTNNIVLDNCTWNWAGWSGCSTFPIYNFKGGCGTLGVISTATITGSQVSNQDGSVSALACNAGEYYITTSNTPAGCTQAAGLSRVSLQCQYHMQ